MMTDVRRWIAEQVTLLYHVLKTQFQQSIAVFFDPILAVCRDFLPAALVAA